MVAQQSGWFYHRLCLGATPEPHSHRDYPPFKPVDYHGSLMWEDNHSISAGPEPHGGEYTCYSGFLSCLNTYPSGSNHALETGYVLLEYIQPKVGRMLSMTWKKYRNHPERRRSLFRGLSRLILTLARIPQPRIGSWQFHNNGTVTRIEPYVWDVLNSLDA
ncbi:hypothetical protein SODALDRAFT_363661 [Sodiomyces alkalinus F11]|uniref:Uncharacterized protein n=1 Tax=Sodiomyces alkalinus (strain CBS 110278 / VKM F-3762 / F11) TaxID=1314773 RepID=A0A3N2PKX0_SODAK|nr:hypothetical protein SODALDRAFT_363661 [Sodiomyces alkalinus F11]ROT34966.1 hypothetical protein SODALDRAFT_363661 [Sodiomyces alkalinus F11]